MSQMKIGILGTGIVGQTLGTGFIQAGHDVKMGSREAFGEKAMHWVHGNGPRASSGTFAETAQWGDVIVLATLGAAAESVIHLADPANFMGKVVIDATNPLVFEPGKAPTLSVGFSDSCGEMIQRLLPGARVVKAFNTVGAQQMIHPQFEGGPPDMFICGDDPSAKETVAGICKEFGWNSIDIGGIEASRYLEPLAMVWIRYALKGEGWSPNHAFKLLHK